MDPKPTYNDLEARLAEAEKVIDAIRGEQVDAILGKKKSIYLIRLKEMEEALRKSKDELEMRVHERTAELEKLNEVLRQEIEKRRGVEQDLRRLSQRLLEAQETERRHIALDLHDSVGGSLTSIKMAVERKLDAIQNAKPVSESITLEEILDLITECMKESRRIQHNLRPSVLDLLGLVPAIRSLCQEFEDTHSINTNCALGIDGVVVPEDLKITIYRISQEALNNAVKHSGAENVSLSLNHEKNKIQLMISDDGCGFDMEEARMPESSTDSVGLSGMKERCELSGGSFSIDSRKGEGTAVCASWRC